jgi:hypothetical protein
MDKSSIGWQLEELEKATRVVAEGCTSSDSGDEVDSDSEDESSEDEVISQVLR